MKGKLKAIIQYILFLGAGLFLVWWQLKSMTAVEKENFYLSFQQANYWVVIPVIIMAILSHLSRAIRWKLLMAPMGYRPRLSNVFAVTMVGYLANSAVPRLGEILKCSILAKYEKLKIDKLVGTIIIERIFDFFCYIIFICLTILIQLDVVGNFVKEQLSSANQDSGIQGWIKFLLILSILTFFYFLLKYLFKKYPGNPVFSRIMSFVKGMSEGFRTIRNLEKRKEFLFHTFFIWSMYLLQIWLGFYAMQEVSHLGGKAAFSVLTLATLAMIITPGGIGSFPVFVMQTLALYGISEPAGNAFGWLMWGVSTVLFIISGITALLALPVINKKNKYETVGQHPI